MRRVKSSIKNHRPVTVSQKPVLAHACGVDVHSRFLVACAKTINPDGTITKHEKTFPIFNQDLKKFKDWLTDLDCTHVCMESTSVYWCYASHSVVRFFRKFIKINCFWSEQSMKFILMFSVTIICTATLSREERLFSSIASLAKTRKHRGMELTRV